MPGGSRNVSIKVVALHDANLPCGFFQSASAQLPDRHHWISLPSQTISVPRWHGVNFDATANLPPGTPDGVYFAAIRIQAGAAEPWEIPIEMIVGKPPAGKVTSKLTIADGGDSGGHVVERLISNSPVLELERVAVRSWSLSPGSRRKVFQPLRTTDYLLAPHQTRVANIALPKTQHRGSPAIMGLVCIKADALGNPPLYVSVLKTPLGTFRNVDYSRHDLCKSWSSNPLGKSANIIIGSMLAAFLTLALCCSLLWKRRVRARGE